MSIRSRYQTPGSARRFGSHRLVGRQVMDDDINEVLGKSRFSHCIPACENILSHRAQAAYQFVRSFLVHFAVLQHSNVTSLQVLRSRSEHPYD